MNHSKPIPVRKWLVRLDGAVVDESAAKNAWHSLVRAQGWSPVGEPVVINRPEFAEFGVVGRIVQYPGLTISPDVRDAIRVPA